MTLIQARTNEDWLTALRAPGLAREEALADLRTILIRGLRSGLVGSVNTDGPEFQALAEDFVQEALLKILDNLDSFQGKSKFTTWAHKIAINLALSELRRKRWEDISLESLLADESGDPMLNIFAASASGPDEKVEQEDLLRNIRRILEEELTEKQRTAMVAVQIKGMPVQEVARQMDMKRNALYKLMHDARLRLKQRLAHEGLSPEDILASFE